MPDTSMPPKPSLYSTMMKIITYKSKGSMPNSFMKNEEKFPCLNRKPAKREGMHLLKDVLAPSELVVGWRKVGMSWIKEKGEAASKTLESISPKIIHITQTSMFPGICAPTWRGNSQLIKFNEIETYSLSPLPGYLPKWFFKSPNSFLAFFF